MSKVISFFKRRHSTADSFEEMIAPHIDALYRQAYQYSRNEDEAEDLLQELLVETYQRQDTLRAAPVRRAWLSRSLYHRFVDRYRKTKASPQFDDIDTPALQLPALESSQETQYLHDQLRQELDMLSAEQRMVISLHDIEGYTLKELSETLGMPLGTLKSHLHRGRKTLQKRFDVHPFDEPARYTE
ncbi:MAG: sigma-70 family RNA polymerase sigma factor [Zhongshania sp.]|uniref:RNA polymerase sigma factor n=1 Tax=Zhongshania sp. TaxID=1971902 RepID=UPI00261A9A37|nr:sigma-70 family RNA polymerase sigma factor [Zhongshania sp.]MDF1692681.1 sigma-70 family RNA polymerase sigma factor [Zhongshania sp.]